MHSKRERPSSLNKYRELFQRSRPSAAAELTETRLLVRAHVAVRGAASAGAVVGGESPQGAIEPAHPALQVVAVGTGEALGLVAVARQAGAVAGVARALSRLVETAESETRLFKPQSDKIQSRCVCGGERSKNSSFRYDDILLWAIGPAAPLVKVQFIAAFGAADAVIAVPPAGFTVGRTFLTQVGSRVSIGTSRTLHHTGTILVQEISCDGGKS